MKSQEPVIEMKEVSLAYPLLSYESLVVFQNLNFRVFQGEKVGILGPSGMGKSSFLKIIHGSLPATSGQVIKRKKTFLIPQIPSFDPFLTVHEILQLETYSYQSSANLTEILNTLELIRTKNHLFSELSAGQKQRLAIAVALVSGSEIILADEPFGRLDHGTMEITKQHLYQTVDRYKLTLIICSHYRPHFSECDRVLEIKDKRLVEIN